MLVLVVLTLLVAVAALALALRPQLSPFSHLGGRGGAPAGADEVPSDVLGLRQEVAALRAEARGALRHLAVVRYDAFGGATGEGGRLSWSLVLADDEGSGVVLTSIAGRSEVRSYAKPIAAWSCDQQLSPEETEALDAARRDG